MEQQIKKILKSLRLNESLMSTLLGVGVVIVVGVLLYNYFSGRPSQPTSDLELEPTPQPRIEVGTSPAGLPKTHKVIKGEDLWLIAEKYYGSGYNWTDIAAANNLKNVDRLEEGMELTIPAVPAKQQTQIEPEVVISPASVEKTDKYIVAAGESLWDVAVKVYADGYQWPKLWQANKDKIGPNPNRLEKGLELSVPRNN